MIALSSPNTRGATGWCLEAHDLVLAKCVAGREKDWAFAAEAIRHAIVEQEELEGRLATLPVDSSTRQAIARRLEAIGW